MVWRASHLEGGRWFEPGFRYPFFQDGFTAYPVHIRVFAPASAPSSSQFIHFLDRPTGRDPQDLSAPLDGLCAYIPGSWRSVGEGEKQGPFGRSRRVEATKGPVMCRHVSGYQSSRDGAFAILRFIPKTHYHKW